MTGLPRRGFLASALAVLCIPSLPSLQPVARGYAIQGTKNVDMFHKIYAMACKYSHEDDLLILSFGRVDESCLIVSNTINPFRTTVPLFQDGRPWIPMMNEGVAARSLTVRHAFRRVFSILGIPEKLSNSGSDIEMGMPLMSIRHEVTDALMSIRHEVMDDLRLPRDFKNH